MLFYTHVNEDNAVEREALADMEAQDLFVIAGSGERVLALLDQPGLSRVYVVDNNPHALYLCALKIAALKMLPCEAYLRFTGVAEGAQQERLDIFERLAPRLSEACRLFWVERRADIAEGVCNTGHFERFLAKARPWLRFFLGSAFYQCLEKPGPEWPGFPHFRWALVRRLFSLRATYWFFGLHDAAFLSKNADLRAIPAAMQQSLEKNQVQTSCLFHLVMNGHIRAMPAQFRPPSFQPEVLNRIKKILEAGRLQVHYVQGDAAEALQYLPFEGAHNRFFSLSDLLSFLSWSDMKALLRQIASIPDGQNRVVFRSFVRNRLQEPERCALEAEFGRITNLSEAERSYFYQAFQIDFNHATT